MKTAKFSIVMAFTILCITFPQITVARKSASESEVIGTYVGRQLGRIGPRVVTLILQPSGKASMAVAPTPGARAQVSTGTWRLVTSSSLRVDVVGMNGNGIFYYNRFGDKLNEVESPFEIRNNIPITLVKQPPIPGTYTAIRSGSNILQTLSLCLKPDGTAVLTIQQTTPKAAPIVYTGTWNQMPTGDVQVSLSYSGSINQFTLSRTGGNVWATSQWDRAPWGKWPLTFAGER